MAQPQTQGAKFADAVQRQFALLRRQVHDHRLVYLDSAATSLRPESVIQAEASFYRDHNANVHRGLHTLAAEADELYENSRRRLHRFIGAGTTDQVIWTRNATAGINMVAHGVEAQLQPGDEIVLTEMEHHANLLPWIQLAKRSQLVLKHLPFDDEGKLDLNVLEPLLSAKTKVLAFTHSSNVLGTINPVAEIIGRARQRVKDLLVLVDAAQAFGHQDIDFATLDADFLVLSAHKAYGPMGVGALVGRKAALQKLEPMESGGSMIDEVQLDSATWADLPQRLEAGTPNVAGVVAVATALDFIESCGGTKALRGHEISLCDYALSSLKKIPELKIYGPHRANERAGLVSFVDPHVHPHDMSSLLDGSGIALRAGHHCTQPLHRRLGVVATNRMSLAAYSRAEDIDALVQGILDARKVFA